MSGMLKIEGMRLDDFAALAGRSVSASRDWLTLNGYRVMDGVIRVAIDPRVVEEEIAARIAAAPPAAPCWRCGARTCAHQAGSAVQG